MTEEQKRKENTARWVLWYRSKRDDPEGAAYLSDLRYRSNLRRGEAFRARARREAREYARKHPERKKALNDLSHAIQRGEIKRPSRCQNCKRVPLRGRDGRTQIQGHHPDYSKPLEVIWLCKPCHSKLARRYV